METVISPDRVSGHVIQKYQFKVLTIDDAQKPKEQGGDHIVGDPAFLDQGDLPPQTVAPVDAEKEIAGAQEGSAKKDEIVEQMLKKADELSTNLIKMQMQLEKQQEEFAQRLEEEKQRAYEEGLEAGRSQCETALRQEIESLKERLAHTIEALAQTQEQFAQKIDSIEEELIDTAIDLAKQVVVKEIEKDSHAIALRLAKLLLSELKEASTITLKVNPKDYDFLKEHLQEREGVTIVQDSAVGEGGVVIVSDVGHIDGEIMHRFERIKEAVFGVE